MHAYILAGHRAGGAWTVDRARDVIELRRGGILGKGTENALDDEGHRGLAIALEPHCLSVQDMLSPLKTKRH